jgi:hypothetical protein
VNRGIRVTVLDTWDEITIPRDADQTVASVKRAALDAARVAGDPDDFEVKYLGAELRDERQTVGLAGVPDGAALIVLRRRRRAVR